MRWGKRERVRQRDRERDRKRDEPGVVCVRGVKSDDIY